ncbi:hypothetical protein [Kitasatospora sp. NPDC087314]|uniref:hypothetical protein n=1 Tax=Kitasatospora sp. NPDC087314 TaxID=3364068 RepID=UPI00380D61B8
MQSFTHDRYAEQPPTGWIGRHWMSTAKDGSGRYLRGVILDVRPGSVHVQWQSSEDRVVPPEWTATDRGTLARE